MAFVAECLFCGSKVRAPEGADGLSVPCPRCGNSFTLAAQPHAPVISPAVLGIRKAKPAEAPLSASRGPLTPAVLAPLAPVCRDDTPVAEAYVRQALGPDQLPVPSDQDTDTAAVSLGRNYRFHLPGVLSLFLASMALVLAQVPLLVNVVIPLAGAGLLLGVVGILACRAGTGRGRVVALGGSAVSLAVLLIMCLRPELLGLEFPAGEGRGGGSDRMAVYSYEQKTNLGRDREKGEWVDAGKQFVQHGNVRIRVDRATLQRVAYQEGKARRVTADRKLVIGLRVIAMRPAPRVLYESWGAARENQGGNAARLQDSADRSYPLTTLPRGAEIAGEVKGAGALPPGKFIKDVLVFEAPAQGFEYLRLELPASAFGGSGTLRFQLGRSMIRKR